MARAVLITGGAGFIGCHTANALVAAGHRVRVLDNLDPQVHGEGAGPPAHLDGEVEFLRGDARDPDAVARALAGVEVVFHLAGLTGTAQSMYDVRRYMDVNVTGTATLWDVIVNRRPGVERVILASSRAVYGEGAYHCPACAAMVAPEGRSVERLDAGDWDMRCPACGGVVHAVPTPETHPLQPRSVYATTKRFQEELCRQAADATGVAAVVLRYFNVYGPHQALGNPYTGIAPVFCSRLLRGEPIQLYEGGRPKRDMVHVRDVVRANLAAMECAGGSDGVNVGTGVATTIADVARAVCRALGAPERLEVTGLYRVGDVLSCVADTGRARRLLGEAPCVGIEEGMRELVAWVLHQEREGDDGYGRMLDEIGRKGVLRGTPAFHR